MVTQQFLVSSASLVCVSHDFVCGLEHMGKNVSNFTVIALALHLCLFSLSLFSSLV